MKTFKLIISTPSGNVYENEVSQLSVRGVEGSLSVLAGHIPFITTLVPGKIRVETEDEDVFFDLSDGILTVTKEKTTILCGKATVLA